MREGERKIWMGRLTLFHACFIKRENKKRHGMEKSVISNNVEICWEEEISNIEISNLASNICIVCGRKEKESVCVNRSDVN